MKVQLGQFDAVARELFHRVALSVLWTAALALGSAHALAEKPEGAGQGKAKVHGQGKGQGREDVGEEGRSRGGSGAQVHVAIGGYFQPQQRTAVQAYYGPIVQAGRCPPGLAKKNKGCLPPGQARAYTLGRPLPSQVVFYDIPSSISVQIGLPPAGHRYVRVAADILLIAVGTGMVVDAIQDLGRM